jgi:hypothetical protein
MLKSLGLLVVILLSFLGGYYLGSNRLVEVSNTLSALKQEVTLKTSSLEREVNRLRLRMSLVDIRDHLINTKEEFNRRNFGIAQKEVKEAKAKVAKALTLASDEVKNRLHSLDTRLAEVESEIKGLRPKVATKLDEIKKEVDRLIEE